MHLNAYYILYYNFKTHSKLSYRNNCDLQSLKDNVTSLSIPTLLFFYNILLEQSYCEEDFEENNSNVHYHSKT